MKVKVYNLKGQNAGEIELKDEIFGVKVKPELVHQVFVQMTNNQREPWADTKDRGEVSGGGKKPWKQKGTGRARHGSIRSPLWKGGGVTFGPLTERNYKTKINRKVRRLATKMVFSDKVQSDNFLVVDEFSFVDLKTKLFAALIKALPVKKSYLVLGEGENADKVYKMARNLSRVTVKRVDDANVMDLLAREAVLLSKSGVYRLEKILK